MVVYQTKEELHKRNFYQEAIDVQDASNIVAVSGLLQDAMRSVRFDREVSADIMKDAAVKAIFFKLYDMLGSPTEAQMYAALKSCENIRFKGE